MIFGHGDDAYRYGAEIKTDFSSSVYFDADLSAYLSEAQRLRQQLSAIDGLLVMDTATHFMLVNIDRGTTYDLRQWLIDRYGILIRDASNFRSLDNHCFRVTTCTREEDDRLVEALKAYLNSF